MKIRGLFLALVFCVNFANAQTPKTGEFVVSATPNDVLGSAASQYNANIDENAILQWEVYVPEDYDTSKPAGIMVYAGAPPIVREPSGWLSVMKDKNLIWVAARKSDNGSSIHQKQILAMLSVPLIQKDYNIDQSRIYITGEGRTAARTALNFPDIFTGAIFMGNRLWEDNAETKVKNVLDKRFVFVTREANAFPKGNRYGYNKFRGAGVENVQMVHIKGRQRYNRPKFASSVDYLDG